MSNKEIVDIILQYLADNPERYEYLIAVIAEEFNMDPARMQAYIDNIKVSGTAKKPVVIKKTTRKKSYPSTTSNPFANSSSSSCGGNGVSSVHC